MSQNNRVRLELEALEDRCVPSDLHALPADFSNVIAVPYKPGGAVIDVIMTLPKGIYNAATEGGANFGLDVTLTYVSVNNTVETLDSGFVPISTGTVLLNPLDNNTVVVDLNLSFGALPLPGGNPSYSAISQVFSPAGT
jgi:hypothetical protein